MMTGILMDFQICQRPHAIIWRGPKAEFILPLSLIRLPMEQEKLRVLQKDEILICLRVKLIPNQTYLHLGSGRDALRVWARCSDGQKEFFVFTTGQDFVKCSTPYYAL